mgnify:CR=1 FL=1
MSLTIDSQGQRNVVSSQHKILFADKKDVDNLNKAIENGEFILFDLSKINLEVAVKYIYAIAKMGGFYGQNQTEIFHRLVVSDGNPSALLTIAKSMYPYLTCDQTSKEFIGNNSTYSVVGYSPNTEEGIYSITQAVACCIGFNLATGNKAILYVEKGTSVPYIMKYIASVIPISKEEFEENFSKSAEEVEAEPVEVVEEPEPVVTETN